MIRFCALALAFWPVCGVAQPVITSAEYADPTTRYAHGILGDAVEWGALQFRMREADGTVLRSGQQRLVGTVFQITLPEDHVFEDIAPRLWDVTGDGVPEMVVIETDVNAGAALAIYGPAGKIAETPHIGRTNRWLAPIGAVDMDGDGHIEIAYVDRPHLAKTLRVWRFMDGELTEIAAASGLTNHRIGEDYISGGIRDCGQGPEMITADANWTNIMATRLVDGQLQARIVGPHEGRQSFDDALNC